MKFYILIELFKEGFNDDSMVQNTGYSTEKEAKKMAKQIEKETGNYVSIHEIEVKRKKAA